MNYNQIMDKTQLPQFNILSNSLKILSAEAVENAKSGHPGMPLGFADVFTVLAAKFLNFNPMDPKWHGRDRLILSAGHGSMLLYSFFHMAGFSNYTLDELKNFRKVGSITPGHPEYNLEHGIETTTGPLGQGFANSVGMAIAQKKYQQKLGDLFQYKIYCIAGDGCLMEGITSEAASIAGHLALNNLIVLFDSNKITIDGSTDLSTSDDHKKKFESMGWSVLETDGHDFEDIERVLLKAQYQEKPTLIICNTIIGLGSGEKAGSEASHGAPLGEESLKELKKNLGYENEKPFNVPRGTYDAWQQYIIPKIEFYENWAEEFSKLSEDEKSYLETPNVNQIRDKIIQHNFDTDVREATRKCAGRVIELIQKNSDKIICGSADLSKSNNLINAFTKPIVKDDFSGNFIHFGVRENAMAAIMNGICLQNFICLAGSFLVFSDYMRPSIRLSALMGLPLIYIMTHDSIGVGEDGPTHQPIEHLASLRSIPNLNLYRPADMLETVTCFYNIFNSSSQQTPSILALSRQKVAQLVYSLERENNSQKGASIIEKSEGDIDVALWATGSEVELALDVKEMLNKTDIKSAVISISCFEQFLNQDQEFKKKLQDIGKLKVGIEAGVKMGWDEILGNNGIFFGLDSFGASGPSHDVYQYKGLTPAKITHEIIQKIDNIKL